MAGRKSYRKLAGILGMIIGLIVTIAIGGLFINGTMTDVVLLKFLPLIVHQIVGWIIIVGAILSAILAIIK